jgi:hypothetical protein
MTKVLMRIIALVAVLSIAWASDALASCRHVTLPEIVGVAVFKHYRHDGGEVVDVLSNHDVVRYYRGLGSKVKVRRLVLGKVRRAGWVPKGILSQQRIPCVVPLPAREQQSVGVQGVPLFDLFQLFLDSFKLL